MTLDEAIKHAEEVAEKFESLHETYENMDEDRLLFRRVEENECKNCAKEHRQLANWLKELKQLREQEPCEDAVSRQAVFETIDDCNSDGLKEIFCSYDDGERFKKYIKNLPPVAPTREKGKWIYSGSYDIEGMLYCSCCKHEIDVSEWYFKFCPDCGAEMEVPELEQERKRKQFRYGMGEKINEE